MSRVTTQGALNFPRPPWCRLIRRRHCSLIRTIGAASTVLLKNEGSVLPLAAPKTMAIVGTGARSGIFGPNQCLDHSCNDGVLAVGWGSGYVPGPPRAHHEGVSF